MGMKIGNMRVLNIKVMDKKDNLYYEGMVENAPADIKEIEYNEIKLGNPTIIYIDER